MIIRDNILKIMEIFFSYPEKKFHMREIERMTKLSLPGVRDNLKKLEKENLVISSQNKIMKNYFALRSDKFTALKRSYNLYSLFTSGFIDFLRNIYEEPEAIILFGSYSKGEDNSTSDIDIAVISRKELEPNVSKFEKILKRRINIMETNLKKSEPEFLNSLTNGIVLYGFLRVMK